MIKIQASWRMFRHHKPFQKVGCLLLKLFTQMCVSSDHWDRHSSSLETYRKSLSPWQHEIPRVFNSFCCFLIWLQRLEEKRKAEDKILATKSSAVIASSSSSEEGTSDCNIPADLVSLLISAKSELLFLIKIVFNFLQMYPTEESSAVAFKRVKGHCLQLAPPLPDSVESDSFVKFAGTYFQKGRVFAKALRPLPTSLLQLSKRDEAKALVMMSLVSGV